MLAELERIMSNTACALWDSKPCSETVGGAEKVAARMPPAKIDRLGFRPLTDRDESLLAKLPERWYRPSPTNYAREKVSERLSRSAHAISGRRQSCDKFANPGERRRLGRESGYIACRQRKLADQQRQSRDSRFRQRMTGRYKGSTLTPA